MEKSQSNQEANNPFLFSNIAPETFEILYEAPQTVSDFLEGPPPGPQSQIQSNKNTQPVILTKLYYLLKDYEANVISPGQFYKRLSYFIPNVTSENARMIASIVTRECTKSLEKIALPENQSLQKHNKVGTRMLIRTLLEFAQANQFQSVALLNLTRFSLQHLCEAVNEFDVDFLTIESQLIDLKKEREPEAAEKFTTIRAKKFTQNLPKDAELWGQEGASTLAKIYQQLLEITPTQALANLAQLEKQEKHFYRRFIFQIEAFKNQLYVTTKTQNQENSFREITREYEEYQGELSGGLIFQRRIESKELYWQLVDLAQQLAQKFPSLEVSATQAKVAIAAERMALEAHVSLIKKTRTEELLTNLEETLEKYTCEPFTLNNLIFEKRLLNAESVATIKIDESAGRLSLSKINLNNFHPELSPQMLNDYENQARIQAINQKYAEVQQRLRTQMEENLQAQKTALVQEFQERYEIGKYENLPQLEQRENFRKSFENNLRTLMAEAPRDSLEKAFQELAGAFIQVLEARKIEADKQRKILEHQTKVEKIHHLNMEHLSLQTEQNIIYLLKLYGAHLHLHLDDINVSVSSTEPEDLHIAKVTYNDNKTPITLYFPLGETPASAIQKAKALSWVIPHEIAHLVQKQLPLAETQPENQVKMLSMMRPEKLKEEMEKYLFHYASECEIDGIGFQLVTRFGGADPLRTKPAENLSDMLSALRNYYYMFEKMITKMSPEQQATFNPVKGLFFCIRLLTTANFLEEKCHEAKISIRATNMTTRLSNKIADLNEISGIKLHPLEQKVIMDTYRKHLLAGAGHLLEKASK